MSSKKLLSELMTKINSEDILNETGGKWQNFNVFLQLQLVQ